MKRTLMLLAFLFLIGCNSNTTQTTPYSGVYRLSSSTCFISFTELYLNSEFRLTTNDQRSGIYSDLENIIKFEDGLLMKANLEQNLITLREKNNSSCIAIFTR